MASREGQGMQIAVILFAMLTVVLAITTYIYYAQAEKAEKARVAAVEVQAQATKTQKAVNYQLTALKFTLGIDNIGLAEVDAAKNAAGGAVDPAVDKWIADYNQDMGLFGAAAAEGAKNYRTLPVYLLGSISRKNQSVVTADKQVTQVQAEKKASVEQEQKRAETAETSLKTATDEYTGARAMVNESLATTKKEQESLAAKLAENDKNYKKQIAEKETLISQVTTRVGEVTRASQDIAKQRDELQSEQGANIDNPDATILWTNQKQRLVWLDKGYDDGLGRQMSFAVYSQNQASLFKTVQRMRKEGTGMEKVKKLESKGRIEVVRIVGPHQAECRILEDKASDPILPGDWVHTPAWSPGQRMHFALMGFMDIDGDLQSDREMVKNIITMNGGVIDTEIKDDGTRDAGKMSVNTRYVVVGSTSEKGNTSIKNLGEYEKTRNAFVEEMERYAIQRISVQQLLDMMGWKPEEKTTGLSGSGDVGFRPRTPGAKPAAKGAAKPAAADGAAEKPAAEKPAAEKPAAEKPAADDKDPFGEKTK